MGTILPQLQFPAMDVWVQAHNIPIECYYSDLAHLLGSAAGHLLEVDWSEVRTRSLDFFRFKIRIHTDEPLIPGAFIELLEGDFHWIPFRYERLFRICYKCGRIGHSNHACNYSLVETLENLHQRYNESPFSSSFPLILENNKPMFSTYLRALRNTDCNRTSRIWVLYEEEVQNMEMDQNLVFNVDSTDSHSSADIYHTPEGDPSPPVQPMAESTPPPAQPSSSWWQSAISMFSPPLPNPAPSITLSNNINPPPPTPNLFDQHPHFDQPNTLHAPTSNPPPLSPLPPPPPHHNSHPTNLVHPLPILFDQQSHTDQHNSMHALTPNPTSNVAAPCKVSEVFRCSAPEFNGDDCLVISDSSADTAIPISTTINQQSQISKKRSSSSSDADSPRGGKRSKLVQLNQREQPPGISF
ncbi:hypothetical protein RHMOL_Rhmol04G0243700 [Rhododendron molle]|uniref:Uncharacterized protein n=1 Tax=Rhododendron molle TaxID=49168 RepID=A0ACC0P462_RHOML|nr:hypothetical protein RHMOL_Rhmol04G0243700 [Rhododendron molle]